MGLLTLAFSFSFWIVPVVQVRPSDSISNKWLPNISRFTKKTQHGSIFQGAVALSFVLRLKTHKVADFSTTTSSQTRTTWFFYKFVLLLKKNCLYLCINKFFYLEWTSQNAVHKARAIISINIRNIIPTLSLSHLTLCIGGNVYWGGEG